MEARYEICTVQGYVEEVFEGSITKTELVEFFNRMLADPKWRPNLNILVDLSGASVDLNFDDMYAVVGFLKTAAVESHPRCAFIAPQTVNYGMLRMYESLSDDLHDEMRLFTERNEALEWLLPRQ
jgi:hypothetical protein